MKYLLLAVLFFAPSISNAAIFYTDFSAGCGGNGLATTTPFCSLDEFADVARSAGDILHVRRGTATTTGITDIIFTSDGTLNNPITITADYDNLWGDFSTSSVTATVTQGSTTMPTSASSTDITVGDWVYIAGDCYERSGGSGGTWNTHNPCEYAYEVATATPTYLEFYFAYKGFNSGTGKTIRRMPPNPQWSTTTQNFQIVRSGDDYWVINGLTIYSTDSTCNYAVNASKGGLSRDLVLIGDNSTACGLDSSAGNPVFKTRVADADGIANSGTSHDGLWAQDLYINCGSSLNTGLGSLNSAQKPMYVYDATIINCLRDLQGAGNINGVTEVFYRNVRARNVYDISGYAPYYVRQEDVGSAVGVSLMAAFHGSSNTAATTTIATDSNLRSGGGLKNSYVIPPSGTGNTGISTRLFPHSYIKLFEYPIYSDGSSKTYTMYFQSASTSAFTASPFTDTQAGSTTPELFIECEYYADPTDADRVIKRSNTANDVDFTSAAWQDISVTCDPSQAGILYLRGYYGKPKEVPSNQFYMDTTPIIQ